MATGPLSTRVAALCAEVAPRLTPQSRSAVVDLRQRLGEPLRVAIAGRLKAGKSTLVNALIGGRRVAPTQVGECTRLVTQFRYGTSDRVDVVRRDGNRVSLPLDSNGMIPQKIGVPRAEVSYIDVTLSSERLRDLTVVDTPGLSSTNEQISASSKDFLLGDTGSSDEAQGLLSDDIDADSAGALTGAEAIVYVFTQSVRQDDVEALEAFRTMSARLSSNPINSLGLFNKVDKLVGTGDPWPVAGPLATSQAEVLRRQVSDVVPLVGLLAETTESGRLTAADCEALRQISGMSAIDRQVLTASVDLFVNRDCPVSKQERERLLVLLDLYGIRFSLSALEAEPDLPTNELSRRLFLASGFPRVRQVLDRAFRWRSDAIKAGWALTGLEQIALARRTCGIASCSGTPWSGCSPSRSITSSDCSTSYSRSPPARSSCRTRWSRN
ncbi:dynamin family protein [Fodinicola feengrottensis]|uniref:dynamin family protein n=1 Tax=Fodinicola feengrottensis TaxID=435914 RepID=UPI0024417EB6|nr:dynamin family protein [Fodinicola feengrottensis]